jgi:hypothetical protein
MPPLTRHCCVIFRAVVFFSVFMWIYGFPARMLGRPRQWSKRYLAKPTLEQPRNAGLPARLLAGSPSRKRRWFAPVPDGLRPSDRGGRRKRIGDACSDTGSFEPREHVPQPAAAHAAFARPAFELVPGARRGEKRQQRCASSSPARIRARRLGCDCGSWWWWMIHVHVVVLAHCPTRRAAAPVFRGTTLVERCAEATEDGTVRRQSGRG